MRIINIVPSPPSKVQLDLQEDSAATPPTPQGRPRDKSELVCSACRAGPFSFQRFRQAVLEFHVTDTTGYLYTRPWSDISQSVRDEACNWCRIVIRTRDGLPPDKYPYDQAIAEVRLQIDAGPSRKHLTVFINGYKAANYTIYAEKGDPAVKEIGTEVLLFPKEPYVDYQRALEAVKECNDHEHCSRIEETYLPTRVIDCADPSKPRLVETHRQIRGQYCTLSYVWGGNQTQKTTNSNIGTYTHEGINVPLPQTIADAILVTNKLGLRYLWVDALCIIQDSEQDKIRELGIMSQIYRNAYLTISALSAFRADHGFLPDARGPDVLPFYLADRSVSPGRMLIDYIIPRQTPNLGKYETVVMHRPLDERGWCFQESMLSPRRISFQPPEVSYICRSFHARNIARPSPFNLYSGNEKPNPANNYILFPTNKELGSTASYEDLREQWRRARLDYSERKITVPSDKLVAFSSIAEVFQAAFKDNYIAGLWEQNLLYDLLWEVCPPMGPDERHLPRPAPYRAPTWSWASVDGRLTLSYELSPPADAASYEAAILSCEATPKISTLPFGELVEAELTIRAKMHPLMRDGRKCMFIERKGTRSGDRYVSYSYSWNWTPPLGNCLEPKDFSIDGLSDREQIEKRVAGISFDCLEGTEQDREMDFYVVIFRAGRNLKDHGDWMHGLLVLRVDGEVEQYRRVGLLNLQNHFEWPDWFDATPLKTITLI